MNPSKISVSVQPFTTQVTQRLQTISNNIATRTAQGSDDIGFINNTSEPVFKMLAIGNAVPGSNTAESLIATYKDVIALDYAETFLNRAIKQALSAFSQSLKRSEVEAKYIDNIGPVQPTR
jgi:conjugative transfer pilus assembly protein TraH